MGEGGQISQVMRPIDSDSLLELGLIVVFAVVLISVLQRFVPWVAKRFPGEKRLLLLSSIPVVRLVIILWAIVLIVPIVIEPSLQNMVVLLGSVGLAIGFALKDYVSSLIAGVVAVGEQNYRNGDWVRIGNVYGEVRHVGMRTLEIVTPDDDRVLVPHQQLWTQPIHNANNGDARLQCVADFYLHPEHDGLKVCQVLEDVALTSPYLYFDDPVAVVAKDYPWGSHYRIRAYPVDSAQQFRFITDLTIRGRSAIHALGIRFAVSTAVSGEGTA